MKTKLILTLGLLTLARCLPALAQNTVVTYQGRVTDNGTNFNGTGQFKFALITSTNNHHTAKATSGGNGDAITFISVVDGGNGYTIAPTVTITGGGGSGATATANISGGVVTSIIVNNSGSGYTLTATVTVSPPPENLTVVSYWSNDGTSNAGSEPATSVSVPVANGLFTVGLGDTTLANMAALDAALFQRTNLQLRIWFNDGVNGFAALSPTQPLTTAPYAAFAYTASSLATASNQPVNLSVNGTNVLRITLVNDPFNGITANSVGGSPANVISNGLVGGFIGGGGNPTYPNRVGANYASVLGGLSNTASGFVSTAMGFGTTASGNYGSTAMGYSTTASGNVSTAMGQYTTASGFISTAMGNSTTASGEAATAMGFRTTASGQADTAMGFGTTASGGSSIAMGFYASASGFSSTAMGDKTTASGNYSFAGGRRAKALNDGSFVWGDSTDADFGYPGADKFQVRAKGGVLFYADPAANTGVYLAPGGSSWSATSDRNAKENFREINPQEILAKVAALPVLDYNLKSQDQSIRHLGPMAQDFAAAFHLGEDDKHITTIDADGVALAAIQGLNEKVEVRSQKSEVRTRRLEEKLQQKETEITELKQTVNELKELVMTMNHKLNGGVK